jgi:AraC-like DNA-binding protein
LEPSPSLGPAFVDPLLLDPSVPFLLFESEAAASLYQKALAIFQIMQSHENGYPLLALSGLYAFYQDFLQRKGQEKAVALTRSPQALLLKKMLTFIYSHYQEPIEGDDIALAADLSSGYAIHLFSQLLRTSPMVYLRSYRLQKAAELLRDPTFNIEEIAAAVGFLSPSYFAASFHKEKGMSPREYRKLFISSSSQKE